MTRDFVTRARRARFGPDSEWLADDAPDDYAVDAHRRAPFAAAVRRYWPALPDDALEPACASVLRQDRRSG